jgi:hypothetical protein
MRWSINRMLVAVDLSRIRSTAWCGLAIAHACAHALAVEQNARSRSKNQERP